MKTIYYIVGSLVVGFVSYKIYEHYFAEKEPTQEDKENRQINFVR